MANGQVGGHPQGVNPDLAKIQVGSVAISITDLRKVLADTQLENSGLRLIVQKLAAENAQLQSAIDRMAKDETTIGNGVASD